MNKLWFGMTLSDAVDKPRLHNQLAPNQDVSTEREYPLEKQIVEGLKRIGHTVQPGREDDFAVVQAIYRKGKGLIHAKSDPRKYGAPAGQ